MKRSQRVYVFDLFRTLVGWAKGDEQPAYERVLEQLGVARERIYTIVRDYVMVRSDLNSTDQAAAVLFERLGYPPQNFCSEVSEAGRQWHQWNQRVQWFPCARDMLSALRQQRNIVGLLTNITAPGRAKIFSLLGIEQCFDFVACSCQMGWSKPNHRLWEHIEAQYKDRAPSHFTMVGDSDPDDLAVPRGRGWETVLVAPDGSSLPQLLARLTCSSSA